MAIPEGGVGQISYLRIKLSNTDEEVLETFIEEIAGWYAVDADLAKTAKRLLCSRRSLERAMNDFPKLGKALREVLERRRAFGH